MKPTPSQKLKNKIFQQLQELPVAGFLVEEMESIFKHLHFYKLKNVSQNLAVLEEYLVFLDEQNSLQFAEAIQSYTYRLPQDEVDADYFISSKYRSQIGEEKTLAYLTDKKNLQHIQQMLLATK